MMGTARVLAWVTSMALAAAGCASGRAGKAPPAAPDPAAASDRAWDDFWRTHGVAPAPPRDFLAAPAQPPEIRNLTGGAIDDETARRWVMADLRRSEGDAWAVFHQRLDVTDAGVLGPKGLNGSRDSILEARARGVTGWECPPASWVTAAVVAVSPTIKARIPRAELTDFVIVLAYRSRACQWIFADGHREPDPAARPAGALSAQVDAGTYRENPVVGPLWYQARGWACGDDDDSGDPLEEICRLARPTPTLTLAR